MTTNPRLFGRVTKQELTFHFVGTVPPIKLRVSTREADDMITDIGRRIHDAAAGTGIAALYTLGTGDAQSFVNVVAIAKIDRHTVVEGRPRVELRQDADGRPYLYEPSGETAYPVDYIDPEKLEDRPTGAPWSQFAEAAYAWIEGDYDPSDGVDQRGDRVKLWLPHEVEALTRVATFDGERVDVLWINDEDGTTAPAELEPVATGETLRYLGEELVKRARELA